MTKIDRIWLIELDFFLKKTERMWDDQDKMYEEINHSHTWDPEISEYLALWLIERLQKLFLVPHISGVLTACL